MKNTQMRIQDMRNLGFVTEKTLSKVGVTTPEQLRTLGALKVAKMLEEKGITYTKSGRIHSALQYALIGAIDDVDWRDVARLAKGVEWIKIVYS